MATSFEKHNRIYLKMFEKNILKRKFLRISFFAGKCFLCILMTIKLQAQDPEFSQFFSAPLHLNPALAGMAYGPRINMNYRNEWPGLGPGANGGFVTYMVSYDQHIEAIRSGIGFAFLSDRIASGILSEYTARLMYSTQIRVAKHFGVRLALEGSYTQRNLDWAKLLIQDQNNSLIEFSNIINVPSVASQTPPSDLKISYFDMAAGALFFSEKHFIGIGVKHFLQPNQSHNEGESKLPVRAAAHAGSIIYINQRNNSYFSPNILYAHQQSFVQINAGVLVNVDFLFGGLWFRHTISNPDAVIALVGFRKSIFKIGYSYDITISKLRSATGGVHELSLSFQFKGDDNSLSPRARRGILDCPDILNF